MKKWFFIVIGVTCVLLYASFDDSDEPNYPEEIQNPLPQTISEAQQLSSTVEVPNSPHKENTEPKISPLPEHLLKLANPDKPRPISCERPTLSNEIHLIEQVLKMSAEGRNKQSIQYFLYHLRDLDIKFRITAGLHAVDESTSETNIPTTLLEELRDRVKKVESSKELIALVESLPADQRPHLGKYIRTLPRKLSNFSEEDYDRLLNSGVATDINELTYISGFPIFSNFDHKAAEKLVNKLEEFSADQDISAENLENIYIIIALYQDERLMDKLIQLGLDPDIPSQNQNLPDILLTTPYILEDAPKDRKLSHPVMDREKISSLLESLSNKGFFPSKHVIEDIRNKEGENYWSDSDYLNSVTLFREDSMPGLYSDEVLPILGELNIDINEMVMIPQKKKEFKECLKKREDEMQQRLANEQSTQEEFISWIQENRHLGLSDQQIEHHLASKDINLIHIKRNYEFHTKRDRLDHTRFEIGELWNHTSSIDSLEQAILSNKITLEAVNLMPTPWWFEQAIRKKDTDTLSRYFNLGIATDGVARPLSFMLKKKNFNDFEFLDFLHSNGVTFNEKFRANSSLFDTAIQANNLKLAKYLVKQGIALEADRFLEDALIHALHNYHPKREEILNYLIAINFPVYEQHRKLHREIKKIHKELPDLPAPK